VNIAGSQVALIGRRELITVLSAAAVVWPLVLTRVTEVIE
jgi:hypothetical protein